MTDDKMLRLAGLETTPYQNFLLDLKEELPVIHGRGCLDPDGGYYSLDEAKKAEPFREILEDYDCLVYNHSYSRTPVQTLFHLDGEG